MKIAAARRVVLGLMVASAAHAETATLRPAPDHGKTIGQLMAALPRSSGSPAVRRKVIYLDTTDIAFIFPSAGSVAGAGGTYFRSDVTLVNYRLVDQAIAVGWMPQGVDNTNAPLQYFVIPANTPLILRDFVAQTLGKSGLGSILVTGVTSAGDPDSLAELDGYSRIWTPQPNASGTVSTAFPSISILDSVGSAIGYALGLRHDSGYRTNVGVVNLDSVSHTWTVGINGLQGSGSLSVSVPPFSMRQMGLPAGTHGDLVLSYQTTGADFWWSGFAASVDNITGDGWVSHAMQP